MAIRKATKQAKKLVLSFQGGSGSGKTFSALNIAKHLVGPGQRVGMIDTENSADLYSAHFDFDVDADFGTFGKLNYHPNEYVKKLTDFAAQKGPDGKCLYGAVIIDSATHLWKGPGGLLSEIDRIGREFKARTGRFADSHSAWKEIDPVYAKFMNDLRHLPFHVFFCLRAKQHYDRVQGQNGKTQVTKAGVEPEFRDGFEYDVDAQLALDEDHNMVPKKHRLGAYLDGKVFSMPGEDFANTLKTWLSDGAVETGPLPVEPKVLGVDKGAFAPTGKVAAGTPAPIAKAKVELSELPAGADKAAVQQAVTEAVTAAVQQTVKPTLDEKIGTEAAEKLTDGQAAADAGVAAIEREQTLAQKLASEMAACTTRAELSAVAVRAKDAKAAGEISADENKALTKVYTATNTRLKAAEAAAAGEAVAQ